MAAPDAFIKALRHEPITCFRGACPGHVDCAEVSLPQERVKSYRLRCDVCDWEECIRGHEDGASQWEEAELQAIIDEHLLHLQPECPYDQAPVVFTSLPNPRRKARYRISCYYCGRQVEMDWPPRL
ncbi:MAG: hypothetical protein OXB94_07935 [Nitrospira sp.]|nr:hypothetical protein [Nitrospira sp.]